MVVLASLLVSAALYQGKKEPVETPVLKGLYQKPWHGPTLSEIKMSTDFSGTVTLPVPSDYSGQVIVSLKVECKSAGALKSWVWGTRADKLNSVIEATTVEGARATITYTAMVLCPTEPVYRTMGKNFAPWLASTALVPASDPVIKTIADRLNEGVKDQDEFVRKVVLWVANQPGALQSIDFTSSPQRGSKPMMRANLCNALLRSKGIAARSVATLPTWAAKEGFQHWMSEYWTDEGSWAMVDPTVGLMNPGRNTAIVLAIPSPVDENRPVSEMLPYLSAPVGSRYEIHVLKSFPHQAEARVLTAGYRRSLKVRAAAEKGQSAELDEQLVLKTLANGPGEFALLLDGRPSQRIGH